MASAILNIARWLAWQLGGEGPPALHAPARITVFPQEPGSGD